MKSLTVAVVALAATGCIRIVELDDDDHCDADDETPLPLDAAPLDAPDLSPFDCAIELPCPPPLPGKLTVCGRLVDLETNAPVAVAHPTRTACTGVTADGPCSIALRFVDFLEFSMNPVSATPIAPESLIVDDCGRFRATNLNRPAFGFIGVVTDDAAGTSDRHRPTLIVSPNGLAAPAAGRRAYVTRSATNQAWTAAAGLGGQTLLDRGLLVLSHRHRGNPVAGVSARRAGNPIPNDDLYFSDPGPTRSTVAPAATATGANGTALVLNVPSATNHSGAGAEPPGCRWPESLGAAIPGAVMVLERDAETTTGAPCP